MTYKTRMCYVVMRESIQFDMCPENIPVAVFYDQETAEGNAEGYNLDFKEKGIEGIRFYVAVTCAYE